MFQRPAAILRLDFAMWIVDPKIVWIDRCMALCAVGCLVEARIHQIHRGGPGEDARVIVDGSSSVLVRPYTVVAQGNGDGALIRNCSGWDRFSRERGYIRQHICARHCAMQTAAIGARANLHP